MLSVAVINCQIVIYIFSSIAKAFCARIKSPLQEDCEASAESADSIQQHSGALAFDNSRTTSTAVIRVIHNSIHSSDAASMFESDICRMPVVRVGVAQPSAKHDFSCVVDEQRKKDGTFRAYRTYQYRTSTHSSMKHMRFVYWLVGVIVVVVVVVGRLHRSHVMLLSFHLIESYQIVYSQPKQCWQSPPATIHDVLWRYVRRTRARHASLSPYIGYFCPRVDNNNNDVRQCLFSAPE